jgi:hypothetical protein
MLDVLQDNHGPEEVDEGREEGEAARLPPLQRRFLGQEEQGGEE